MKLLNKFTLLLVFITFTADAYSYSTYYCAKNFRSVSIGASMDTVRSACGDPTTTNTQQIPVQTPLNVVQWVYTLGLLSINGITVNMPSLTVIFSNNTVIEIDKNNVPITAGGYCNINGIINIGDNMNTILARCGRPNFINQRQLIQTSNKTVIEWVYNFGPYRPQVLFDFENGILTQIKMG